MSREPFETFTYPDETETYTISLYGDDDGTAMSPAEWDTFGTMYALTRDDTYDGFLAPSETHGQAIEAMERRGVEGLVRYLSLAHGLTVVPYDVLDYGGGNVLVREASLSRDNGYGCSGYIAGSPKSHEVTGVPTDPDSIRAALRGELQSWSDYFEGNVIGYVVTDTESGNVIDSCWGFYPEHSATRPDDGYDYVREQAREVADDDVAEAARIDHVRGGTVNSITPADLISVAEIAELAGVGSSAVSNWHARATGFPPTWGTWGSIRLWLRADVEEWLATREAVQTMTRKRAIDYHETMLARLRDDA